MKAQTLKPQAPRPIVWSIAGSDSGGGAGIQADLLTCHDLGVHACTVISAITAQNSLGVNGVEAVSRASFVAQLDAVAEDLPAAAIKIGLLPGRAHVELLAARLHRLRQDEQRQVPYVIYDPVAVASSGHAMATPDLLLELECLLPELDLITPNGLELQALTGIAPSSPVAVVQGGEALLRRGVKAVLVKGGHLAWQGAHCLDFYSDGRQSFWLETQRLETRHGHGTGCCYASAIAALVAQEYEPADAITLARAYLQQGLSAAQAVGQGPGPLAHLGWPSCAEHFPRVVLPGSMAAQRLGLVWDGASTETRTEARTETSTETSRPEAQSRALPTEGFALCPSRLGLYPVVDSLRWVEQLLAWGVRTLQLRIKDASHPQLEEQIRQAIELGHHYEARLFINDHWQLALKHGAYGVHLGQEDLECADLLAIQQAGLRLGISTHGYYEIARALSIRPSYIALGHIFPTKTKEMPSAPQGLVRLERYARLLEKWPTVAIGGITMERVDAVVATGVGSVALVTAITESATPERTTHALLQKLAGEQRREEDAYV